MISIDLSLDMGPTYDLNEKTVDTYVEEGKIGNYALGYEKEDTFYVCYVGRSDSNLKERIKQHINELPEYSRFKFSYAMDIREAYVKECKNWHDFGGRDGLLFNKVHPDKPNLISKIKCPYCED